MEHEKPNRRSRTGDEELLQCGQDDSFWTIAERRKVEPIKRLLFISCGDSSSSSLIQWHHFSVCGGRKSHGITEAHVMAALVPFRRTF